MDESPLLLREEVARMVSRCVADLIIRYHVLMAFRCLSPCLTFYVDGHLEKEVRNEEEHEVDEDLEYREGRIACEGHDDS